MGLDWKELGRQVCLEMTSSLGAATGKVAEFKQSLQWVQEHPGRWLSPPVVACATDFVESELDWRTEGSRGYGRVTESVPRLAGWQREGFSRLDQTAVDTLKGKIATSLVKGYAISLLMEGAVRKQIHEPKNVTKQQLWEKWIPLLYGSPGGADAISALKPTIQRVAEQDTQSFKTALSDAGIRIDITAGPRFGAIVNGYLECGVLLRQLEVWGKF